MSAQLAQVRAAARAVLPAGWSLASEGAVMAGDMVWDFCGGRWVPVALPKPMRPGQKRPGAGQHSEVGRPVQQCVAVARQAVALR